VSALEVLAAVLRGWFPGWDIWHERGVWHATGFVILRASTIEALLDHLAGADPDAFERAAKRLLEGVS